MNLLYIVPSLKQRGAQMFVRELAAGLQSHEVSQSMVVLNAGIDELGMHSVIKKIEQIFVLGFLGKFLQLRKLIKEQHPDIIFAVGGESLKYTVLACCLSKRPKIIYRKIGLTEQWMVRYRWVKLPFQRWLVKQADAISTVGEAIRKEAIDLFHVKPDKIEVIYRGVCSTDFLLEPQVRFETRLSLGLPQEAPVLIAIGVLGWEKNLVAMLRILTNVRQSIPSVVLLFAGDGPERVNLEQQVQSLGLLNCVYFLGVRNDVSQLLAASDLLLLTSLTEGVPGVLIEAGMAGRPCVTWDVAGASEVICDGHTGYVTPYKDEKSFAGTVVTLLSDSKKSNAMGHAARRFCHQFFSVDQCVEKHMALFLNVMNSLDS